MTQLEKLKELLIADGIPPQPTETDMSRLRAMIKHRANVKRRVKIIMICLWCMTFVCPAVLGMLGHFERASRQSPFNDGTAIVVEHDFHPENSYPFEASPFLIMGLKLGFLFCGVGALMLSIHFWRQRPFKSHYEIEHQLREAKLQQDKMD